MTTVEKEKAEKEEKEAQLAKKQKKDEAKGAKETKQPTKKKGKKKEKKIDKPPSPSTTSTTTTTTKKDTAPKPAAEEGWKLFINNLDAVESKQLKKILVEWKITQEDVVLAELVLTGMQLQSCAHRQKREVRDLRVGESRGKEGET
jgi:hypothetical protein